MSKENEYQDIDDTWEEDDSTDEPENDTLLESIVGNKDARRRLDDILEERRLRVSMADDF
ncbi:MAG: hypothetical protein JXJ30_06790 [Halothiobacillaceae bacterium]|nr:hypothetical protein [Halothiobacillaceae bacterium]HER34659.1 hypothetical protein [Halothiobacillaceae bacterium]